ncbi:MAG TPA: cellulase family glycosylhydrolase [Verrucomicrobiae bacterium]
MKFIFGSGKSGRAGRLVSAARSLWMRMSMALFSLTLIGLFSLANAANAPLTFLHARGQDIVNEQGDPILLRGVGLGNWMLPEGYMWKFGNRADRPRRIEKLVSDLIGENDAKHFWAEYRKSYIAEPDIQRIAALGYNSVRPALNSRLFLTETDPPRELEEGIELLDNLVRWCKANNVYVIIDMHGAPGGQTGQNIDDSANDLPELFMNPKHQDQLVALWEKIARRYKDEPAVAGYDLLNEPLPERTGAAAKYKAQLEPLYQRITKAIRAIDSKHMIILEGADWSNDWSVFTKPFDKNLVYQFHYYCWDTPVKLNSIQRFLDARERLNVPVWVGETGEKDDTIYWATTDYFEANNIGWSFWPWKKMETQNTPYSIKAPKNWSAITAYSNGGEKPSQEIAGNAFSELLTNIRLENCVFFPGVVNAMLRQAPVKIEAENFGHDGQNKSFFVTDPQQLSDSYRHSEPVAIHLLSETRRRSAQYVTLTSTEWTAYNIWSDATAPYRVTVKAKAANTPAQVRLQLGDRVLNLKLEKNAWEEIELGSLELAQGKNNLKWSVTDGAADLDWIQFSSATSTQTAKSESAAVAQ